MRLEQAVSNINNGVKPIAGQRARISLDHSSIPSVSSIILRMQRVRHKSAVHVFPGRRMSSRCRPLFFYFGMFGGRPVPLGVLWGFWGSLGVSRWHCRLGRLT